jgi:hypothetical protein
VACPALPLLRLWHDVLPVVNPLPWRFQPIAPDELDVITVEVTEVNSTELDVGPAIIASGIISLSWSSSLNGLVHCVDFVEYFLTVVRKIYQSQ